MRIRQTIAGTAHWSSSHDADSEPSRWELDLKSALAAAEAMPELIDMGAPDDPDEELVVPLSRTEAAIRVATGPANLLVGGSPAQQAVAAGTVAASWHDPRVFGSMLGGDSDSEDCDVDGGGRTLPPNPTFTVRFSTMPAYAALPHRIQRALSCPSLQDCPIKWQGLVDVIQVLMRRCANGPTCSCPGSPEHLGHDFIRRSAGFVHGCC
jgi:hypothetical protein